MPGYQHIRLEKDADTHIATLTLNRPEKRNALNDQTMDELGDALDRRFDHRWQWPVRRLAGVTLWCLRNEPCPWPAEPPSRRGTVPPDPALHDATVRG